MSRRIAPQMDLNLPPPLENGTTGWGYFPAISQGSADGSQLQSNSVEAIDDDIAIIDRSTFTEATNNMRRNHSRHTDWLRNVPTEVREWINGISELSVSELEFSWPEPLETAAEEPEDRTNRNQAPIMTPAPAPAVAVTPNSFEAPMPAFTEDHVQEIPDLNCRICLGPYRESTTTRCGHVFCKECITRALEAQGKCPTCRRKLGRRSTFRIYL